MALPLIAIAALAGLAKHALVDRPAHKQQVESEAITQKYSPWTGQQANFSALKAPNAAQSAIDFGLMGAGYQQENAKLASDRKFNEDYLDILRGDSSSTEPRKFDAFTLPKEKSSSKFFGLDSSLPYDKKTIGYGGQQWQVKK